MYQEIETKFDVPLDMNVHNLLKKLERIVQENGFTILSQEVTQRNFQYYDTPNLDVYMKGETLRRVSGFESSLYRYDFKAGPIEERYEANHWSDRIINPAEILNTFNFGRRYLEISPSANATTQHRKIKMERGGVLIEGTLDYFNVFEGSDFRELELELECGEVHDLNLLAKYVHGELGLKETKKQKYSRVIESISGLL